MAETFRGGVACADMCEVIGKARPLMHFPEEIRNFVPSTLNIRRAQALAQCGERGYLIEPAIRLLLLHSSCSDPDMLRN